MSNNKGILDNFLDRFTKKELFASLIIIDLIAIIVVIIVWKFSNAKEVVEQIGFAASVSSIVLAFLAIIYAFFQTNVSTEQNTLLQLNVQKISEQIQYFRDIRDDFGKFQQFFKVNMENLILVAQKIDQGFEDFNTQMIANVSDIIKQLEEQGNSQVAKELEQKIISLKDNVEEVKQKIATGLNQAINTYYSSLSEAIDEQSSIKRDLHSRHKLFDYHICLELLTPNVEEAVSLLKSLIPGFHSMCGLRKPKLNPNLDERTYIITAAFKPPQYIGDLINELNDHSNGLFRIISISCKRFQ